jgi:hypothetical protein
MLTEIPTSAASTGMLRVAATTEAAMRKDFILISYKIIVNIK